MKRWLFRCSCEAWRHTRRAVVTLVGLSVILIGVVMIVTPGPAFVVIPAGLAILAIEFVWARRLLRRVKIQARRVARRQGQLLRRSARRGAERARPTTERIGRPAAS